MCIALCAPRVCWLLTALTALCSCAAAPDQAVEVSDETAELILDQVHGNGTQGFFFLQPINAVPPTPTGTFEPRLAPEVRLRKFDTASGSLSTVTTYTYDVRSYGSKVRRELDGGYYIVRLDSKLLKLDPSVNYRVEVLVGGRELGFADIDVVKNAKEAKAVNTSQYVVLMAGATLPVRFRIDKSVVDRDGDGVFDWLDNCPDQTNPDSMPLPDVAWVKGTSAKSCHPDVSECDVNELDCNPITRAVQPDTDGDGVGDACDCPAGYTGGGSVACTDIDECDASPPPCDPRTTCTNTAGAYTCGACPSGFTGTGYTGCTDIDECAVGNGGCGSRHCENTPGSHQCTTLINPSIMLSAGFHHTCALRADSSVACWGYNAYQQLGNGVAANAVPTPKSVLGLSNVIAIAAGGNHSCALQADARVACWGDNAYGQLGNGDNQTVDGVASVVGLSDVTAIAAGFMHTCALRANGSVACWGNNHSGQLGDGSTTDSATPRDVPGLAEVTALATGSDHTCALRSDGSVACWGSNASGQLGDNSASTSSAVPVAVTGLNNATALAARQTHTCALRADGSVACWGSNINGELGNDAMTESRSPVTVAGISNAAAIAVGSTFSCALHDDGSADCWGYGEDGQLGNGSAISSPHPVRVNLQGTATALTAGAAHACALLMTGDVACRGSNSIGELGNGLMSPATTPVAVSDLASARRIAAGLNHTCAVTLQGGVACWGFNGAGQLGNGSTVNTNVPVAVSNLSDVTDIAAGGGHTCALQTNGTVACWGNNQYGALGDGSTVQRNTPVQVTSLSNVTAIAAGGNHSCALLGTGTVLCWGDNGGGQLGDGTHDATASPVMVSGLDDVVAISAGPYHSCAVRRGGLVACWGDLVLDASGEFVPSTVPVTLSGLSGVTHVSAGNGYTCARHEDGSGSCWGENSGGQLGNGSNDFDRFLPAPVVGLSGAVDIATCHAAARLRDGHTCAVQGGGTIACWGNNRFGELGDGSTTSTSTLVYVSGIADAVSVAVGSRHTCALRANGSVACWGSGYYGELGNKTLPYATAPQMVVW